MEFQHFRTAVSVIKILAIFFMINACKTNNTDLVKECDSYNCDIGALKNNKKEGVWKRYDKHDRLIQTSNYSRGKLNGPVISYYPNGTVYSTSNYIDDTPHGNSTLYFENGKINFLDTYFYGKKEGYSYLYDKEGNLVSKYFYVAGKRDGEQYEFGKKEDTVKVEVYRNGILLEVTNN